MTELYISKKKTGARLVHKLSGGRLNHKISTYRNITGDLRIYTLYMIHTVNDYFKITQ